MAEERCDVVIVGGGPGGLACGLYSARAGLKTVLLEEMGCGGQTMFLDRISNYPGLPDVTGFELADVFQKQAESFGCTVVYEGAVSITKGSDGLFAVATASNVYRCPAVVLATGCKHKALGVPGEKEYSGHGVSYCATCDGAFFKGKPMLVCGGSERTMMEALYLSKLTNRVVVCHNRSEFAATKATMDALEATGHVAFRLNTEISSINGTDGKVSGVSFTDKTTGRQYTEDFAAVFVFVGNVPQTWLVPDVSVDSQGFIKTDVDMMTSVQGLYAVGDVRDTPFRQVVTAASDGAVAAHAAGLYIGRLKRAAKGV